jgi:hypothetical protein
MRDPGALAHQTLALAGRPLGVLLRHGRDNHHPGVVSLAVQPTKECALQRFGVEPIRLRAPALTRYCNAGRMNDMCLDAPFPQPARQPEAVPAGLVYDRDPRNGSARCENVPNLGPTSNQGSSR